MLIGNLEIDLIDVAVSLLLFMFLQLDTVQNTCRHVIQSWKSDASTCPMIPEVDNITNQTSSNSRDISLSTSESPVENERYDVGILHHTADTHIAKRIKMKLTSCQLFVCEYSEFDGTVGHTYAEKCIDFLDSCVCVLWVATLQSLKETNYLKFCRDVALDHEIQSSREDGVNMFTFEVIVPQEYNSADNKAVIPRILHYWEPIVENQSFERRMLKKIAEIKKNASSKLSKSFVASANDVSTDKIEISLHLPNKRIDYSNKLEEIHSKPIYESAYSQNMSASCNKSVAKPFAPSQNNLQVLKCFNSEESKPSTVSHLEDVGWTSSSSSSYIGREKANYNRFSCNYDQDIFPRQPLCPSVSDTDFNYSDGKTFVEDCEGAIYPSGDISPSVHGSVAKIDFVKAVRDKEKGKHIMISYNHQDASYWAEKTYNGLKTAEYDDIWFDQKNTMYDLDDDMAAAVENAYVVLVFMTEHYFTSKNCKQEAQLARDLGKKIIPIKISEYEPEGWLNIITARKRYYYFTMENFDGKLEELKTAISGCRSEFKRECLENISASYVRI